MILLSSQATILMKSLSIDFWDIPSISDCDAPSFQPRPYGQLFYRLLISVNKYLLIFNTFYIIDVISHKMTFTMYYFNENYPLASSMIFNYCKRN